MNLALLTESIKEHEGLRNKPYTDSVGKLTIGYGRNLSNNGISLDEANYMLANDIQQSIKEAQSQPWWLSVSGNDARERAMVEMAFNIGLPSLNGFVKALSALGRSDYYTAAAEFRNSKWAQQVGQRSVIITYMIENGKDYVS